MKFIAEVLPIECAEDDVIIGCYEDGSSAITLEWSYDYNEYLENGITPTHCTHFLKLTPITEGI